MRSTSRLRKVLLFGALGAFGCLIGWGIGEVFLESAIPWANALQGVSAPSILTPPETPKLGAADRPKIAEQLAVPTPAPPPTPEPFHAPTPPEPPAPSAEFAALLKREHAHEGGDVQIALRWLNTNDLDLHVIDPAGEEIFFKHREAQSGGALDVDKNRNVQELTAAPVEHVYFPRAPYGHYQVYVIHYAIHYASDPTQYWVQVIANGERHDFEGRISNNGMANGRAQQLVYAFDVEPPPPPAPELRLSAPESLSIESGGSNEFRVRIARGYFDEAVTVSLDGTYGFDADEVRIPRGEVSATVKIHVESIGAGNRNVVIKASADTDHGHVEGNVSMRVKVVEGPKPEPVLKVVVPPLVQVLQGDTNHFKVRVGRYFFPASGAVTLRLEGNTEDLEVSESTVPAGAYETVVDIRASSNARPGKRDVFIVAKSAPKEEKANMTVEIVPLPPPRFGWPTVLIVGLWTALLAVGLSFLLAIGQNRYLGRKLLSAKQAGLLLIGGVLAGALAGGGGQALLAWLGQLQAQGTRGQVPSWLGETQSGALAGIPPEAGQIAGWCLLGLLLGYGVAFFVPNLSRTRSAIAGAIGGLTGVAGFLALTHFEGAMAGRVAGATILGFAIGSMVALVEVAFRKGWLEIRYGPKEVRTVSLGSEPITLGSNQSACTVYAANAAAIAYRYWVKDNAIFCEDVPANHTFNVVPGDTRQVGKLVATVCAAGGASQTTPQTSTATAKKGAFSLRFPDGRTITLANGAKLMSSDVPGLRSVPPGGPVALVSAHPTDPRIHGLQNLSHLSWNVRLPNGDGVQVKPGKNVRLAKGTRVNFGSVEGEMV